MQFGTIAPFPLRYNWPYTTRVALFLDPFLILHFAGPAPMKIFYFNFRIDPGPL